MHQLTDSVKFEGILMVLSMQVNSTDGVLTENCEVVGVSYTTQNYIFVACIHDEWLRMRIFQITVQLDYT